MPREFYNKNGDCCQRYPKEGEKIHPDLSQDETAERLWYLLGWRVEAMRELVDDNCPEDLSGTLYYRRIVEDWGGSAHGYLRDKQKVGRLARDGYELCGWPVVRRTVNGHLSIVEGTHRLATRKGLGLPVPAILIERGSL